MFDHWIAAERQGELSLWLGKTSFTLDGTELRRLVVVIFVAGGSLSSPTAAHFSPEAGLADVRVALLDSDFMSPIDLGDGSVDDWREVIGSVTLRHGSFFNFPIQNRLSHL